MFIYTDDKKYALKVLPDIQSWNSVNNEKLSTSINSFINKVFNNKKIYFTKIDFIGNWQYLFISKYSEQSQFDILFNLSKNDPKLPDGIMCLADSGSKFHGYRNREWNAHSGNLHLSIFKKPNKPVKEFHIGFTILAAVSVIQTIENIQGMKNKAGIKWVNDILIDDAKISGVIAQTQSQQDVVTAVVLGIGLNIEKAPNILSNNFINKTTSIKEQTNKKNKNISDIFLDLIKNLEINYQMLVDGNYQALLDFYKDKSIILNKYAEIYSDARSGENSLIASGKVIKIGDGLELYIEGIDNPIKNGRLKLLF